MWKILNEITGTFKPRRIPWILLLAVIILCSIGAMMIASADSFSLAKRHIIFSVMGLGAFLLILIPDYRHLPALAAPLYSIGIIMLILLRFFGVTINNARRWFDLGPVNLQPSELMKVFLVISLATYFTYRPRVSRYRDILVPLVLTGLPVGLIIMQPDLGTSLVLMPMFFILSILAGVPWRKIGVIILLGLFFAVIAWNAPGLLRDYQRQRLTSFINPAASPHTPAAYNARQATLAIAGGGLTGQGWGRGRLTQLRRIPERHTDFIFPVIAEEWGFMGTSVFVLYYYAIAFLLLKMTLDSKDIFAKLLIGGIAGMFALQGAMHMAISLRLAPITGLTLPLVSYGGSSLIATMVGLGIAANAYMRQEKFWGVGPAPGK